MTNFLVVKISIQLHFSFHFSFGAEFGYQARAEVAAHVAAVVVLEYLDRRPALLGGCLDVFIRGERETDECVPRAVEIPLLDALRPERRIPVVLAPLVGVDRRALAVFEKVITLRGAQLFGSLEDRNDIRQKLDRAPAGAGLGRLLFAKVARFGDRDRPVLEVDIADAQRDALRRPHAGPEHGEDERVIERL